MKNLKIFFVGLVLIGSIVGLWVTRSRGQAVVNPSPINVYAAKFLCGEFPPGPAGQLERGPVKPGNYQTAINVHNPNFSPVSFRKKAVLMFATDVAGFQQGFEIPRKPGDRVAATLEADWGLEIDCADIREVLLKGQVPPTSNAFIKGWVVIEVPGRRPLDIVTAYTAHGFNRATTGLLEPEGFALEIERATPTSVVPAGHLSDSK